MSTRNILITGCSSGIGRCLAIGLKERGYGVFATARQPSDVESLRDCGLVAESLDLSRSQSVEDGFKRLLAQADNRLFALINNAAYAQAGAVEDLSRAALTDQFETNVFGTHQLTQLAITAMRRQGDGRIIQISSILGLLSLPYRGAYCASKHALEALSDALRLELSDAGIGVSVIEPGAIQSRMRDTALRLFAKHVDVGSSPHRERYEAIQTQMDNNPTHSNALPPEAVLKKVVHALESRHPRSRYRVTRKARLMAIMKRALPDRGLDFMIRRFAGRQP